MARFESHNPVFGRSEPLAAATRTVGFGEPPTIDYTRRVFETPQRLTYDDIVVKTGLLLAVMVTTGAVAWVADVGFGIVIVAALVGFALAMVNTFKKQVSPALVLAYAAVQGVFVGGISNAYEGSYRGIVVQAIVGTAIVFGGILAAYKSGKLRATPKFTKVVVAGLLGLIGLVVLNLVVGLFGDGDALGIRGDNLPLSILFSVALITFGALTFVLDFDQAERMVNAGVDTRESWRVSFGLLVGLVFVYLEILRLLSYLRGGD